MLVISSEMASKSVVSAQRKLLDLDYCFRPLMWWMNVFGIPLHLKQKGSRCRRSIVILGSIIYYILNLGCNCFVFVDRALPKIIGNRTTTADFNTFIDYLNFFWFTITTHAILLVIGSFRLWNGLTECLCRLEQHFYVWEDSASGDINHMLRRVFTVGSAIIAIVCLSISISISLIISNSSNFYKILIYLIQTE